MIVEIPLDLMIHSQHHKINMRKIPISSFIKYCMDYFASSWFPILQKNGVKATNIAFILERKVIVELSLINI